MALRDWGVVVVHHVVAAWLDRAASARSLMQAWSVAVDDLANAAVLPCWFDQRWGLHRTEYLEDVNWRLAAADGVPVG